MNAENGSNLLSSKNMDFFQFELILCETEINGEF